MVLSWIINIWHFISWIIANIEFIFVHNHLYISKIDVMLHLYWEWSCINLIDPLDVKMLLNAIKVLQKFAKYYILSVLYKYIDVMNKNLTQLNHCKTCVFTSYNHAFWNIEVKLFCHKLQIFNIWETRNKHDNKPGN